MHTAAVPRVVVATCCALVTGVLSASLAVGQTPVTFTLDKPAKVSTAIYNDAGQLVRRLQVGNDLGADRHTVVWDGLDERGNPLESGQYEWRLAASPGIRSQFVTLLGTSNGYWHWPGAHEGPGSVEVVDGTVIMASHLVEGSPQYIAWDLDSGEVKWHLGPASGFAWVTNLAAGGKYLFAHGYSIGSNEPELLVIDPRRGEYVAGWANWKRAVYSLLPIVEFPADHKGDVGGDPRRRALDLAAFNTDRGHGWLDAEGLENVKVANAPAIGSTKTRSATFRIDLAEHNLYRTAVVVGNPTSQPRAIDVRIAGRKGEHTIELAPGETKRLENQRGKQDIQVTVGNPEGEPVGWAVQRVEITATPRMIAAHGDTLVALLPDHSVAWLDPMQGEELSRKPFTVHYAAHIIKRVALDPDATPRDVEVLPDGRVVVLTDERLVEAVGDGETRTLVSGLSAAARVSADATTGGIFIVEHGESQRIKAFDATFKPVGVFGRKGGRRQGRYVAEDFYHVEDIAGDGRGGFVIVEQESGPRRTAHFDSQGRLIREWYGAQTFFVNAWEDPRQKNHVWIDNGHGWVTECEIDYEAGTWKPYATYKLNGLGSEELDIHVQHTGYLGFHIRYHEGRKYLCKVRDPVVLRVEEENRRVVPVAKYLAFAHNQYTINEKNVPKWAVSYEEARRNKYVGLMWSDLNGDGKPQKAETRLSKVNYHAGDSWVGDDLTYYTNSGHVTKPEWRNGIPVYPLPSEAEKQPAEANWRDADGAYYSRRRGSHLNIHGFGWPSTMVAAEVGLRKYAADGRTLLFDVGNKAVTFPGTHPEGQLHFPAKVAGVVQGVVGVAERVGMPVKFWTTDGLYVGHLFNRHGEGPELAYRWWRVDPTKSDSWGLGGNQAVFQYDTAAGGRLVELAGGDVYFFGAGWNNVPVYKLTGFDEIIRKSGHVTITKPARGPAGQGTGLVASYYGNSALDGERVVQRIESRVALGQFGNYGKKGGTPLAWPDEVRDAKREFSIRLTGLIEPKLTDTYTLFIYGVPADLWIDGRQVLDASNPPVLKSGERYRSLPTRLSAGRKVPIRIEARCTAQQALYLSWEAAAFSAEVVPQGFLYPEQAGESP